MLEEYEAGGFLKEENKGEENKEGVVKEEKDREYQLLPTLPPLAHSTPAPYPVIDLTESPVKAIPLFSRFPDPASDTLVRVLDDTAADTTLLETKEEERESLNSSPELFADEEEEEKENSPVTPVNHPVTPADDKRSHSPDDVSNLVIKRRRISRVQALPLKSSESEYFTSPSSSVTSSESQALCPACSTRLLKSRPTSDTVSLSQLIRGKYEIRSLGKLQFTPFPDENTNTSTLSNMGVVCKGCNHALGRVTFSIDDKEVKGVLQLH